MVESSNPVSGVYDVRCPHLIPRKPLVLESLDEDDERLWNGGLDAAWHSAVNKLPVIIKHPASEADIQSKGAFRIQDSCSVSCCVWTADKECEFIVFERCPRFQGY